jgi:hypothetical protein
VRRLLNLRQDGAGTGPRGQERPVESAAVQPTCSPIDLAAPNATTNAASASGATESMDLPSAVAVLSFSDADGSEPQADGLTAGGAAVSAPATPGATASGAFSCVSPSNPASASDTQAAVFEASIAAVASLVEGLESNDPELGCLLRNVVAAAGRLREPSTGVDSDALITEIN